MPAKKKAPPDDLLAKAAELRAGGAAWDAVAAEVGRAADTVRRWPTLYPAAWKRHLRAAEGQLVTEATAESVHTLRRQLRSKDEKSSRDAAQKLIQFRVALGKRPKAKGKAKAAAGQRAADLARVAAHLEALTDDQTTALLDQLASDYVASRNGAAGTTPPGGPAVPERLP